MKQNLEITTLQSETVSTRQKKIREVMEAGLIMRDSLPDRIVFPQHNDCATEGRGR